MMNEKQLEQQLERTGRALGSGERLVEGVMEHIKHLPKQSSLVGRKSMIRTFNINRLSRVAAVALIAAGCVGVWFLAADGATIALADVHERITAAQTVCFRMSFTQGKDEPESYNILFKRPNLMRMERPEVISVLDFKNGKTLALFPESRTAHSADIQDWVGDGWIADLERIVGSDRAVEIGERKIDGKAVKGWRITEDGEVTTVWADVKTAELVEVEIVQGEGRTLLTNMEYNRQLDDSLFSMEPPEGYNFHTLTKMDVSDPSEADLIGLLRIWASGNGDVFPDEIKPWNFQKAASKADWKNVCKGMTEKQVSDMISRGFFKLNSWPRDWSYVGKGVRYGDATKPVFWYRSQGQKKYRVLFGDLSVQEIAEDQLPAE